MSPVQIWVLAPFLSAKRAPNGSWNGTIRCFLVPDSPESHPRSISGKVNKKNGMVSRTTPSFPYWCLPDSVSTSSKRTSTVLCIKLIHNVVKSTVQRKGAVRRQLKPSAAIAEANCFGIGHALCDDLVYTTIERLAFLLDSTEPQGDCCQ